MLLNALDFSLIIGFLVLLLALGIHFSKRIKSIEEYSVSNRSYGGLVLFTTFASTIIGGAGTIGTVSNVYQNGIIFTVATLGYLISFFMVTKFVIPKFDSRFEGMISAGDILRKYYGIKVEKFSALIVCIFCVCILTAQLIALGHIMQLITGLGYNQALVIFGALVVVYSSIGGIKAVVATDVLQFSIMTISIPLLTAIAISKAGGVSNILDFIHQSMPEKLTIFSSDKFSVYLTMFILYLFPMCLGPSVIQRLLMVKNKRNISKIMYSYIGFYAIILICCTAISFASLAIKIDVNPKEIIPYLATSYAPAGIVGLILAGIIAVIMSTADSFLNTGGVFLSHNFLPKKCNNFKFARASTLVLGVLAIILAMLDFNLIYILLFSMVLLYVGFTLPIIAIIMHLKAKATTYWVTVSIALPIFIVAQLMFGLGFKALLASVASATTIMIATHFTNHFSSK